VRTINPALEPALILRALIAAVPDHRLRDLVVELALREAPSEAPTISTPAPPAPAKRTRRGWSKGRRLARKAKAANGAAAAKPDYSVVTPGSSRHASHGALWCARLGSSDGGAREALRAMVLPSAAVARFLTLPAGATPDRE